MKKLFFLIIMTAAIGSGFFGHNLMNAMAEEKMGPSLNKYYTSVVIEEGDSLWTIARRYGVNSGKTTEEYIRELKNMNGLGENTIHAGSYLTVAYYSEELH